ncbi:MAG: deoxyribose-phosphate aldolase [Proteobacteria bacterium]|nr:deoxyribose-phosphate aldolase [Pseudomonadota bacterium]
MTIKELANYIDLTLLKPEVTQSAIEDFLKNALKYPFASVCIPPCYVRLAASLLEGSGIKVGTVIGFPLGYQTSETKKTGAKEAIKNGAHEIDMVMNISAFKSADFTIVEDEMSEIVSVVSGNIVKVIIETGYLTEGEKAVACDMVVNSGAHYVKTSTGFGPGYATVEDVTLLAEKAAGWIEVKASGGIKNLSDAMKMIDAGAKRLGTSSGIEIVEELQKELKVK